MSCKMQKMIFLKNLTGYCNNSRKFWKALFASIACVPMLNESFRDQQRTTCLPKPIVGRAQLPLLHIPHSLVDALGLNSAIAKWYSL